MNAMSQRIADPVNASLILVAMAFAVLLAALPEVAQAGAGGTAFDDVWLWLKDNIQGTLGRIIVGSMIIVGIIGGVAKQSLIAFAIGVGGGVGLYNTPLVLENLVSATVAHVSATAPVVHLLGNGL